MNGYLILTASVILLCVVCNKISNKIGLPMLFVFLLIGMFFGSDGVVHIPFDNYVFTENICSIALIVIMFYGGFGTKWDMARPIMGRAILLSTAGVILTAVMVGGFCHLILRMGIRESFLIGALISSTDAASVFSILRSKRLNLKYRTASLLEVESGSNDPFAYMMTILMISIMKGNDFKIQTILSLIFSQMFLGIVCGILFSMIAYVGLKKFEFSTEGFDTIFVLGIVLLAYAIPTKINGNGYLSVYILGIILGNLRLPQKKQMVHFFDGITGLMQMILFFLLGLLSFPSQLIHVIFYAFSSAVFLTFFARPVMVFLLMTPFHAPVRQKIFVSWAGLRGAASIVFAIMTVNTGVDAGYDLFHIVFFIVLFSILLQGTFLPMMARKLDMIDDQEDVLKTFNDYVEEVPVSCIQFILTNEHPWCGKKVKEITLPPETLFVQLERENEELIIPNGDTILQTEDVVTLKVR